MHKQSRQQYRVAKCVGCDTMRPIAVGLVTCDRCCTRATNYNRSNRSKGLCTDCVRPAEPGKARCRRHLDIKAKRERAYRQAHIASKLCRDCQTPIAPGERGRRCEYHKYKHMVQERKRKAERRKQRRTD